MTRRVLRLTIALVALTLALLVAPQAANAQDEDVPSTSIDDTSRNLGNSFVPPDIQPGDGDTATTGGTGGGDSSAGLAVTGAETEAIAAISIGLITLGGAALVSSRRRFGS